MKRNREIRIQAHRKAKSQKRASAAADTVPPIVSSVMLSPTKASYQAGEAVTINWTSSDNVAVVSHELRYLPTGDGGSAVVIATGLPGTQKSFNWTIPNEMRSTAAVRVVASDGRNTAGLKSGTFQIVIADTVPPVVSSVTLSPAKASYQAGEAVTINWASSDNVAVVSHELRYLPTGDGGSAVVVASGLPGTQKSFNWTIPNEMRSAAAVRVMASDGRNSGGLKSGTFQIVIADTVAPVVSSVTLSPAKASYQAGEAVVINWTSSDNVAVVSHELRYLPAGDGGSAVVIASGLPGTQKSFNWTNPNEMRSAAVVRVVASDGANNQGSRSSSGFQITTPASISFSPAGGFEGTDVEVSLTGGNTSGVVDVLFGEISATEYSVIAPNMLIAEVPVGVTTNGKITLVYGDGRRITTTSGFMLGPESQKVEITLIKPQMGPVGSKVTIVGRNFIDVTRVKFGVNKAGRNGMNASFERLDDTTIIATVPDQIMSPRPIKVKTRNRGSDVSEMDFKLTQSGAPEIADFSQSSGYKEQSVTILGRNFVNVESVKFGSMPAGFRVDSDSRIFTAVPIFRTPERGPLPVIISVTNDAGTGDTGQIERTFTVTPLPKPEIERIDPASGTEETQVTIVGRNLIQISDPPSKVEFFEGKEVGVAQFLDTTTIKTLVPIGAKSGPVTVTTPGGVATKDFTILVPSKPEITKIDLQSGPVGTKVTITGRNFIGVGAGMVNGVQRGIFFNGAQAINLTSGLDFERLLTEVPQNAPVGPGKITVGGQGGVGESNMDFVVTTATSPSIRGDFAMADNGDIAPQIGIDATKQIVAGRTAVFKRRITAKPGDFVTISVIPLQDIPMGTLIDFPRQLTIDASGKALYEIKVITPVKTLAGNYDYQRETRFFDNGVEVDRDVDILRVVIKPPSVTISLAPSQPSPAPITAGKQDQIKIRVQRKDYLGSIQIVGSNLRGPSNALFLQPANIPVSNSPDATESTALDVFSVAPRPGDDGTLPGAYRLALSASGEVPLGGTTLDVSFQVSIKPDVQIELRPAELSVDTGAPGKFNVNIFRYNVQQVFMPQISGLPPEFNPKLGAPQVNQLPVGDRTIIPLDFFVPIDAEAREYIVSAEVMFEGRTVRDRAKLMVPRPELEITVTPNSDAQTLVLAGGQKQTFEITAKKVHFDADVFFKVDTDQITVTYLTIPDPPIIPKGQKKGKFDLQLPVDEQDRRTSLSIFASARNETINASPVVVDLRFKPGMRLVKLLKINQSTQAIGLDETVSLFFDLTRTNYDEDLRFDVRVFFGGRLLPKSPFKSIEVKPEPVKVGFMGRVEVAIKTDFLTPPGRYEVEIAPQGLPANVSFNTVRYQFDVIARQQVLLALQASTGPSRPGRTVSYGIEITRVAVPMSQPVGLRIKDPTVIPIVPGSDTFTAERFFGTNKSDTELSFQVLQQATPGTYFFEVEASALPTFIQQMTLTLTLQVLAPTLPTPLRPPRP